MRAYETIRAQILNEAHGFRMAERLVVSDPGILDDPPFRPDSMKRLKVYSLFDPISGKLRYFREVDNCLRWYWLWGLAHLSYWHDEKFYEKVLDTISGSER